MESPGRPKALLWAELMVELLPTPSLPPPQKRLYLWLLERGFQQHCTAVWSQGNIWGELVGSLEGAVLLPCCSVMLSRPEALRTSYGKSRTAYFKDRSEFTEHGFCGCLIQGRI